MTPSTSETTTNKRPVMVFDMTHHQCVWSRAGVIRPTVCINAYDCLNCPLDRRLKKDVAAGKLKDGRALVGWRIAREGPPGDGEVRKCRHMLSGLVARKYCMNDYDCEHCPYHLMVEEEQMAAPFGRVEEAVVDGFAMAMNYYYHFGHVWARVEYGGRVRIGLDDFAARLFGPLDAVHLPALGEAVGQGEPGFNIARGENDADCLSPMAGVVVAVNGRMGARAARSMAAPYRDDWMLLIEPTRLRSNLRNLFYGAESAAWMADDAGQLAGMMSGDPANRYAATGGRAVNDIYGQAPELDWKRLRRRFLHS